MGDYLGGPNPTTWALSEQRVVAVKGNGELCSVRGRLLCCWHGGGHSRLGAGSSSGRQHKNGDASPIITSKWKLHTTEMSLERTMSPDEKPADNLSKAWAENPAT